MAKLKEEIMNTDAYLDQLLTENQAAQMYALTPRCFQGWRLHGKGPKFVRMSSRTVRYRRRDLVAYAEQLLRQSTTDPGADRGD